MADRSRPKNRKLYNILKADLNRRQARDINGPFSRRYSASKNVIPKLKTTRPQSLLKTRTNNTRVEVSNSKYWIKDHHSLDSNTARIGNPIALKMNSWTQLGSAQNTKRVTELSRDKLNHWKQDQTSTRYSKKQGNHQLY